MADERRNHIEDGLWLDEGMESPEARQSRKKAAVDHIDRTRSRVYATGNRWATENFETTH